MHPDGLPELFLDRSLGRRQVPTLLRDIGLRLHTLAEAYGIPADETVADTEWLGRAGQQGLVVLMKDDRIRYRPVQRAALLDHLVRLSASAAETCGPPRWHSGSWQRPELRGPVRPSQFGESKPLPAPANSTDASGAECPQNVLTRDTDRQETNCRSDRRREGDRCAYSRSFDPPIAEGRLKCAELDLAAKVHRFDQRLILKAASRLFPTSVEKSCSGLRVAANRALIRFLALASSGAASRQYLSVSQNRP
jgi:PIN domain-containing protein